MKTIATLTGQTQAYKGHGRKLGYPTANVDIMTPLADGVYFGYADLADYTHHPALIFIGTPTTIGDTDRRVEAHLLDISDKDYYDQTIKLSVEHFHRANKTFDSIDQLKKVMKDDEAAGREWFKAHKLAS